MSKNIIKTISISEEHNKYLEINHISLSKYVKNKINEDIKNSTK